MDFISSLGMFISGLLFIHSQDSLCSYGAILLFRIFLDKFLVLLKFFALFYAQAQEIIK